MTVVQREDRITDLLRRYAARLEALAVVLEEEYQSLAGRNIQALEFSTGKKQEILQDIANYEQERDHIMRTMGSDAGNNMTYRTRARLNHQITATLNDCLQQNRVNGAIIEISHQFNQRLLASILGDTGNENLYDATGKNTGRLTSQPVASV